MSPHDIAPRYIALFLLTPDKICPNKRPSDFSTAAILKIMNQTSNESQPEQVTSEIPIILLPTPEVLPTGPSEFGKWLYEERTKKGWSVYDLASKSGVSQMALYNLESGSSQNPQAKTRDKLVEALGEKPSRAIVEATTKAAQVEDVGEFVDFDPHDENNLPDEPGIYVFYDISERPIYVGQTQNIRKRIVTGHREKFWFRAPIVQSASFIKIKEVNRRKMIEKIMIRFLKGNAVLNKQHVDRGEE